jgi:hypothetical protein
MKKHESSAQRLAANSYAPVPETVSSGRVIQDYESVQQPAPEDIVEHLSVPGFIRRVPYRFHMDEITRFGAKVGASAEALQLSYVTRVDRSLGQIRVFPVPLLMRVYQVLARQQGWPEIVDPAPLAPALEDPAAADRESLRSMEKFATVVEEMIGATESSVVLEALAVVSRFLEVQTARLRERLGEPASAG